MKAGELRHRVEIQTREVTRNTYNEEVETWQTIATVFAAVEPLSAREVLLAQQSVSDASVKVTIRYHPRVTNDVRLVHDDQVLEILSVQDEDLRHVSMVLLCRRVS